MAKAPRHFAPKKEEVLLAVESLYQDGLAPYAQTICERLAERAYERKQPPIVYTPDHIKQVCKDLSLEVQVDPTAWWVDLPEGHRLRGAHLVDVHSDKDDYQPEMWGKLMAYLSSLEGGDELLPKSPYECAKVLMKRNLPFLGPYSLGEVFHIVNLAISCKKYLRLSGEHLVPNCWQTTEAAQGSSAAGSCSGHSGPHGEAGGADAGGGVSMKEQAGTRMASSGSAAAREAEVPWCGGADALATSETEHQVPEAHQAAPESKPRLAGEEELVAQLRELRAKLRSSEQERLQLQHEVHRIRQGHTAHVMRSLEVDRELQETVRDMVRMRGELHSLQNAGKAVACDPGGANRWPSTGAAAGGSSAAEATCSASSEWQNQVSLEPAVSSQCYTDAYPDASAVDYWTWYHSTWKQSFEEGVRSGYSQGYQAGHEAGYKHGYARGHQDGGEDGQRRAFATLPESAEVCPSCRERIERTA